MCSVTKIDGLSLPVFGLGKWFEISPHEAGFTDLGLFINTSHLGDRIHQTDPEGKEPEMDSSLLCWKHNPSTANCTTTGFNSYN